MLAAGVLVPVRLPADLDCSVCAGLCYRGRPGERFAVSPNPAETRRGCGRWTVASRCPPAGSRPRLQAAYLAPAPRLGIPGGRAPGGAQDVAARLSPHAG